jgi:hypothetical protein
MIIKQFTHQNLKVLSADIEKALEPVAKKYGIKFKSAAGSFTETEFSKKIEFFAGASDGESVVDLKFKKNLEYAVLYGMKKISEKDYNKIFVVNGQRYRLAGLNPKAKKFPIIAQSLSTKNYHKFGDMVEYLISQSKEYAK